MLEIVFVGAMEAGSDMASIVKALSRKMYAALSAFHGWSFRVNSQQHLKNGPSTTYRLAMYKANAKHANVLRESNLNYTILRLTWLYNDPENTNYELIPEGAQFNDAQVTQKPL